MLIHLALERRLQHPLGQTTQQPTGPGQRNTIGLGLVHQPLGELGVVPTAPASCRSLILFSGEPTTHHVRSGRYTVRSSVTVRWSGGLARPSSLPSWLMWLLRPAGREGPAGVA